VYKATWQYLKDETVPRTKDILCGWDLRIAFIVGLLCFFWGQKLPFASIKSSDFIVSVLAYAAIAVGFSLAGMTLALTLPSKFAEKLTRTKRDGKPNAYSNLLFVFSWTALAHWMIIVISLGLMVCGGFSFLLLSPGASLRHRVGVSLLAIFILYGLFQFLICVITLSQLGNAYIKQIEKDLQENQSHAS
jgi:hypothetical protein